MFTGKRLKCLIGHRGVLKDKRLGSYLCSLPQAVETGQLGELGKAAVIDAEMEMLIQDSEIFIAPPHDPASSLRGGKRES